MNTFQLECFLAVADNLSFVRAAEALHVTQPAISHQISRLEKELGVKLFQRSTRTVRITHDGTLFLDDARAILGVARRAAHRFQDPAARPFNPLSIGSTSAITVEAMVATIAEMNRRFEGFRPRLAIDSGPHLMRALEEGSLDVIVGFEEEARAGANIEQRLLAHFPLRAVFLRDHPLAARETLALEDLGGTNIVVIAPERAPTTASRAQARLISTHTRDQIYFCDSVEASVTLVRAGCGAILLPAPLVPPDPALACRPLTGCEDAPFSAYVAAISSQERNPLLDTFLDIAQEQFAAMK